VGRKVPRVGSFAEAPTKMNHYAWIGGESGRSLRVGAVQSRRGDIVAT
jgi:hypothetical protein